MASCVVIGRICSPKFHPFSEWEGTSYPTLLCRKPCVPRNEIGMFVSRVMGNVQTSMVRTACPVGVYSRTHLNYQSPQR